MNRLKQPSTWAGIATFFQLVSKFVPQYSAIADGITGLASGLAVYLNDHGGGQPPASDVSA